MRVANLIACLLFMALMGRGSASAADVSGAWSTDVGQCAKMYLNRGKQIVFSPKADLYGSGFIIDSNMIRGKAARCTVKARKDDGQLVHLVAACSTSIAVETIQLTFKILGPDRVARVFPSMPELDTEYGRCSF
jgi:hypothetical protein